MKGRIVNYRGGMRTQETDQMVILAENCSTKEDASKLIGKGVEWTTPSGKKIVGRIIKAHGRTGSVLARFNKGLPGQALGTGVEIKD